MTRRTQFEKNRVDLGRKKAKKFGLIEGPLIGKIQQGTSIEHQGKKINPDDITYIEKGRIVAYVTDTLYCNGCLKSRVAKNKPNIAGLKRCLWFTLMRRFDKIAIIAIIAGVYQFCPIGSITPIKIPDIIA